METGLRLEGGATPSGEKELGAGKESATDGGMGLEVDGETGMDGEARLATGETEPEQGVCGEAAAESAFEAASEPGADAVRQMNGGGDALSCANDIPLPSPGQEEEEEEHSGAEQWDEVCMDPGEGDSLQCDGLSHRC